MIYRFLTFVVGLILATVGMTYAIIATSYLSTGFGAGEYFHALFTGLEFYLLLFGLVLLILSLFFDDLWKKLRKFIKDRRKF